MPFLEEEEDLDPAPQAHVLSSSGYSPRSLIKPQTIKSAEPIHLVSPFFSPDRDPAGNQISEISLDQLEAIEEENRRKPVILQVRGQQPSTIPRPIRTVQTYVSPIHDPNPYQSPKRISIDISKDLEYSEDEAP
jgi:hypothetical protein